MCEASSALSRRHERKVALADIHRRMARAAGRLAKPPLRHGSADRPSAYTSKPGQDKKRGLETYSRIWAGARPPRLTPTSHCVAPQRARLSAAPTPSVCLVRASLRSGLLEYSFSLVSFWFVFFFSVFRSTEEVVARREGALGPPIPAHFFFCSFFFSSTNSLMSLGVFF